MDQSHSGPAWLSKRAKEHYARYIKVIKADNGSADLLAIMCQALADHEGMILLVGSDKIITSPSGVKKAHPAIALSKQYADTVARLAGELLLTPKSRSKLDDDPSSSLDSYGDQ